jgi:hypothetical protein
MNGRKDSEENLVQCTDQIMPDKKFLINNLSIKRSPTLLTIYQKILITESDFLLNKQTCLNILEFVFTILQFCKVRNLEISNN